MLTSEDKNRSKSTRRLRIKSPLVMRQHISEQDSSKQKLSMGKSNGSTNDSVESERKAFAKISENQLSDKNRVKNWTSTQSFKNKILVSSCEFNRLKQKLQSNSSTPKVTVAAGTKKKSEHRLKIKILDRMSKQTSNSSQNTNTLTNTTGSSDSQQFESLKIENEYFKKIYDEALGELSKLKNKLKEEKKVHDVQKQIYETQLNKLKRIVDSDKEEVSHIICDEENRCIIVVSTLGQDTDDCMLGLDSDCQDSIGDLSIESK